MTAILDLINFNLTTEINCQASTVFRIYFPDAH